jgi:hypothetical protein
MSTERFFIKNEYDFKTISLFLKTFEKGIKEEAENPK